MTGKKEREQAQDYLVRSQDAAGGWGYRANRAAFVEPTALCLLALADSQHVDTLRAGESWLEQTQRADGSWGVAPVDREGSWATAWAIWSLIGTSTGQTDALERGLAWWETWQPWVGDPGQERDPALWIDPSLTGWPWRPDGTSWVEPTALGIIALVIAGRRDSPRIAEGLRYLRDRVCANGGWNVGNPYMLGQTLPPIVSPTALALLALHEAGLPRTEPIVNDGLAVLDALLQQAHTPLNLAWGLWASRRYLEDTDPARIEALAARLRALQALDGSWRHSPYLTALATMALGETGETP